MRTLSLLGVPGVKREKTQEARDHLSYRRMEMRWLTHTQRAQTREHSGFIGFALSTAESDFSATECRLKCVVWKRRVDLFPKSEEDFQPVLQTSLKGIRPLS